MGDFGKEPFGGSTFWLLVVLVIILASKADSAVADIAVLALTGYAVKADSANRK